MVEQCRLAAKEKRKKKPRRMLRRRRESWGCGGEVRSCEFEGGGGGWLASFPAAVDARAVAAWSRKAEAVSCRWSSPCDEITRSGLRSRQTGSGTLVDAGFQIEEITGGGSRQPEVRGDSATWPASVSGYNKNAKQQRGFNKATLQTRKQKFNVNRV